MYFTQLLRNHLNGLKDEESRLPVYLVEMINYITDTKDMNIYNAAVGYAAQLFRNDLANRIDGKASDQKWSENSLKRDFVPGMWVVAKTLLPPGGEPIMKSLLTSVLIEKGASEQEIGSMSTAISSHLSPEEVYQIFGRAYWQTIDAYLYLSKQEREQYFSKTISPEINNNPFDFLLERLDSHGQEGNDDIGLYTATRMCYEVFKSGQVYDDFCERLKAIPANKYHYPLAEVKTLVHKMRDEAQITEASDPSEAPDTTDPATEPQPKKRK